SRTFPRSASVNRSRPNISSITPKLCIPSLIGVFLLGLTHPMSQFLFFDTERIRLSLFPQHSVHEQPVLEAQQIQIDGETITQMGRKIHTREIPIARRIDCSQMIVMPGL